MNKLSRNLADKRMDYSKGELLESNTAKDPFSQFDLWYQQAENEMSEEVNAMMLSTSSLQGDVSSRVVLLKSYGGDGFLFFTNYQSKKGQQLTENPKASLLFYWPQLQRQVRLEGIVQKVSESDSDEYFYSRPQMSQVGAMVSPQSQIIPNRAFLEERLEEISQKDLIQRPKEWGGFRLVPKSFEFWQGRSNRLHDRICYHWVGEKWEKVRLAP